MSERLCPAADCFLDPSGALQKREFLLVVGKTWNLLADAGRRPTPLCDS
jgi:hypothetical protein